MWSLVSLILLIICIFTDMDLSIKASFLIGAGLFAVADAIADLVNRRRL